MLLRAVRRHKVVFAVVVVLGVLAGAGFAVLRPPLLSSHVLVVVPAPKQIATQALIADSDSAVLGPVSHAESALSYGQLLRQVKVTVSSSTSLTITVSAKTAEDAESVADAVANQYVSLVRSPDALRPGGPVLAKVVASASPAMGTTAAAWVAALAGVGALAGVLLGLIVVVAMGQTDRRLRERDEIAGAVGAPVLASVPVVRPSGAAGWARLLESYEPGVVHAWSLLKALRHVGVRDGRRGGGPVVCLWVVSLSSDRRALAVGPQLAVYAASLGVPVRLVIGPQQDPDAMAALSAACTTVAAGSRQAGSLQFAVGDFAEAGWPAGGGLTVVVAVVDSRNPRLAAGVPATATVLAVSAGAATAEQLARVALSITSAGVDISGIVVADPDPADRTTGRLLQLGQHGRAAAACPAQAGCPADRHLAGEPPVTPAAPATTNGHTCSLARGGAAGDGFAASRYRQGDNPRGLISLRALGQALRRRAWLVCATTVAGLALSGCLFVYAPPAYQAAASVLIFNNPDLDPATQMEGNVATAQSLQVAASALHKLGLHESVASFAHSYTVVAPTDRLLEITASAPALAEAERLANAVAAGFMQERAHLLRFGQQLDVPTLNQQTAVENFKLAGITRQITAVSAEPKTPQRDNKLKGLLADRSSLDATIGALKYDATNYPLVTLSMINGTAVLDTAAPIPPTRKHLEAMTGVAGLFVGLTVGLGLVLIEAVVSDRPRRRRDIARALGAPIKLTIGKVHADQMADRSPEAGGRSHRRYPAARGPPAQQRASH